MLNSEKVVKVSDILLELGITPNLKGFHYILDAIDIIEDDSTCHICEVYIKVGELHNTDASRVERCIRSAFGKCDPNSTYYLKTLGKTITNSERLYTLAFKVGRM